MVKLASLPAAMLPSSCSIRHEYAASIVIARKAFAKLPAGIVENLLKPENKKQLQAVLTYHVVPGKVKAADVVKLSNAKTAQGSKVTIKVQGGAVKVDSANVVKTDILCSNGVIHVIDAVILPNKS